MNIKRLGFSTLVLATLSVAHAEQVCTTKTNKTTPSSRFTISTDGKEVTDTKTGLIWQRCSIGQDWNGNRCDGEAEGLNWKQALVKVKALGDGYRLPNIKEAASIVEAQCISPALNADVFPNVPEPDVNSFVKFSLYWTSTPIPQQGDQAFVFDYYKGSGLTQQTGITSKDILYYGMAKGYARAVRKR